MNVRTPKGRRVLVLVTALLGTLSGAAMAQNHSGGGGAHASGGGGGHAGAAAPRAAHAAGGYARGGANYARGGYAGHFAAGNRSAPYARPGSNYAGYGHPGYGRGYGYGYGRGYGWGGGYWRGGVWFGGFIPALPLFYDTFWWGGVPYYYADDTYYVWSGAANQYQAVPPPGETAPPADGSADAQPSDSADLVVYPNNGQSNEQQSKDRYECYHWAANQSGFDPTQPNGGQGAAAPGNRDGYMRAEAACLEGRGYTVK
jgi:hypothetical protein